MIMYVYTMNGMSGANNPNTDNRDRLSDLQSKEGNICSTTKNKSNLSKTLKLRIKSNFNAL